MFLGLLIALASAAQEPPMYGVLAKADQCADILGEPNIREREIEETLVALRGLKFSEAEAKRIVDDNMAKARAANLPAPTVEECQALK